MVSPRASTLCFALASRDGVAPAPLPLFLPAQARDLRPKIEALERPSHGPLGFRMRSGRHLGLFRRSTHGSEPDQILLQILWSKQAVGGNALLSCGVAR